MAKIITGEFTKKKFTFNLIKREGKVGLFKKSRVFDGDLWTGYEVMIINTAVRDVVMGGAVTMHKGDEFLPSDSLWGTKGWSFSRLADAEDKFTKCLEVNTEKDFEGEPEIEEDEAE
jgi:hypothetical protein